MKIYSADMLDAMRKPTLNMALCWKIVKRDTTELYYTAHNETLTIEGNDYVPTNSFATSALETKAQMSTDNMQVVALTSDDISEEDLLWGKFDFAVIYLFNVLWDNLAAGILPIRKGWFGEVTTSGDDFEVEVRSLSQILQQPIVEVFSLGCRADLGDTKCGVTLATFTESGSITTWFTRALFHDITRVEADAYFTSGKLTWTSGLNNGLSMEVKIYSVGAFVLMEEMPHDLAIGDTYDVYAGCDHTPATCIATFNNIANFRGEPYIPGSDAATEYPSG